MATGGADELDAQSDEYFDILCSMCRKRNKCTEATKFCVDCQDYYCSKCVKFHDNVPALSSHKILDKDDIQPGISSKFTMVPTERCDIHGRKQVDMYCQNHDHIGCSTCMVVEHRSCNNVFFIPDFIKTNADTSNTKEVEQELDTCTNILENNYKTILIAKKKLLKGKAKCVKKLREYRADLDTWLDRMEKISETDIDDKYKQQLDQLEIQMKTIQETKVKISAEKDDLKNVGNNVSQLFVCSKKAKILADGARKCVDDSRHHINDEEIQFIPDSKLTSLINELNQLGKLKHSNKGSCIQKAALDTNINLSDSNKDDSSGEQSTKTVNKNVPLKLHGKESYNIKIRQDKNLCTLSSIFAVSDTTLILSDYSNKRLKRMDCSNHRVTDHCDIPNLYQSCMISEQEIAVSCGSARYIQLVSVRENLVPTRQMKTLHDCKSVCYGNKHMYISDGSSVIIYTLSGDQLQQIRVSQVGKKLFTHITSLAVRQDGSVTYVTDSYLGVIALDNHGNVTGGFDDKELESANDVCITNNGNILVCGYLTQNVLQLTKECKRIEEILTNVGEVQAFCLDKRQSTVIFSCNEKDQIDVYKIS